MRVLQAQTLGLDQLSARGELGAEGGSRRRGWDRARGHQGQDRRTLKWEKKFALC